MKRRFSDPPNSLHENLYENYLISSEQEKLFVSYQSILLEKFYNMENEFEKGVLSLDKIESCSSLLEKLPENFHEKLYIPYSMRLEELRKRFHLISHCDICGKSTTNKDHFKTQTHIKKKNVFEFHQKIDLTATLDDLNNIWIEARNLEIDNLENFDLHVNLDTEELSLDFDITEDEEDEDGKEVGIEIQEEDDSLLQDILPFQSDLIIPYLVEETSPLFAQTRLGILHTDILTRIYYSLFAFYRGKPFSLKIMEAILRVSSNECLKEYQCAHSNYYLDKSGNYFSPRIKQDSQILKSGKVTYFDLEELVAFLLSKKFMTENWISSSKNCNVGAG
jgi:hypothetical protein